MTIWEAVQTPLREWFIGGMMILFLLQGYLCLALRRIRNKGTLAVAAFAQFLVLFILFFLLLDAIFHLGEPEYPRSWPYLVQVLGEMPVWVVILYELLSALCLGLEFRLRRRFREENLTPIAVKEAVDLLPEGIAFAQEDGTVVLVNMTMKEIADQFMPGKVFTNLRDLVRATAPSDDGKTWQAGSTTESRVWQFTQGEIPENGRSYLQLTATDVTAQARINEELQGKNQKLREIKRRLEIYNKKAERIIIAQELLNARMQVHNETGHVLLACRHYMDHPNRIDEEALLKTLKLTNAHLLKEYEEDDTEKDPLAEAIEMAGEIGVKVKIGGMIPEGGEARAILSAAISECATNVKKHADGDLLEAFVEKADQELCFTLKGNGEKPSKPVSEGGGLLSLRTMVENGGGHMEIFIDPVFTLKIMI